MGEVYRAVDTRLDRVVAIEVLDYLVFEYLEGDTLAAGPLSVEPFRGGFRSTIRDSAEISRAWFFPSRAGAETSRLRGLHCSCVSE
jgi:hypothetical protein